MKLNTFLLIAAILYAVFGLGWLFAPALLYGPMGITLDAGGQLMARTGSAAVVGLAVMLWLARGVENAAAVRAILLGNVVYIAVEVVILLINLLSGAMSTAGLPGLIVDALLGVGFGYYYLQSGKPATA
ncbi:MAG: hypothetical protein HY023_02140 [Chloroflexi bacterium]|nr:hypothetical protein [Chloroflexota bacterium]